MNFIESLGEYQNARERCKRENVLTDEDFEYGQNQLLRYRRENNIFEVGDKVVFSNKCALNHSIWQVISVNDGAVIVAPICKHNGRVVVESNTPVQYPYSIQHATPEEIKAGHRL